MNLSLATLSSLASVAVCLPPALAQTDALVRFRHPDGPQPGWGDTLADVGDLDGDGAMDLAVGIFRHGGGEIATVHSGRTGTLLHRLEAPIAPLFYSSRILPLIDETGDGLPELAALGTQSGATGSPNGRVLIYSGADGSLLRQVAPPAELALQVHMQRGSFSPGDVDGDGHGDVLCRAVSTVDGLPYHALLSGASGEAIFAVAPRSGGHFIGDLAARLSDHDGDGLDDFALPVRNGSAIWIEIRSSADGALLAQLDISLHGVLTGNREPFLGIADLDGDGLRDIAIGDIFSGRVALYSSTSGALLQRWDCDTQPIDCFGSRLIEVGDLNGNRRTDLVALESNVFGSRGLRLFGLDPTHKAPLFEHLVPGFHGGYSAADRIVALPGVDRAGFPTFATFEELTGQVSVWRHRPRLLAR